MKAIVLTAGTEFDARPPGEALPTALLPVQEEPLLVHTLRWLKRHNAGDVAIDFHYQAEGIEDTIDDGSALGLNVVYAVEAKGTARALKQIEPFFDDTFVVVHSHLLLDVDLAALLDYHRSRRAMVTVGLKHTTEPQAERMVECESGGRVLRFVQHPATWLSEQRTAAIGLYIAEPAVLDHIPTDRPFDWEDHLLPLLVARGDAVFGQILDGPVLDICRSGVYDSVKDAGLAAAGEI